MNSLDQLGRLFFPEEESVNERKIPVNKKDRHYITIKEGADFYSVSLPVFRQLVVEADAVLEGYGGSLKLVDCDAFEEFLERKRLDAYEHV